MSLVEGVIAILGLALITLLTRGFFLFPERDLPLPGWLEQGLRYAPLAALVAVVAPEIVMTQGRLIGTWTDARLPAGAGGHGLLLLAARHPRHHRRRHGGAAGLQARPGLVSDAAKCYNPGHRGGRRHESLADRAGAGDAGGGDRAGADLAEVLLQGPTGGPGVAAPVAEAALRRCAGPAAAVDSLLRHRIRRTAHRRRHLRRQRQAAPPSRPGTGCNGRFLQDLPAAGFAPRRIDTVLCTHLHVDHVGWNTRGSTAAGCRPSRTRATCSRRTEWEHWSQQPRAGRCRRRPRRFGAADRRRRAWPTWSTPTIG